MNNKCADCSSPSSYICSLCGLHYCTEHRKHVSKSFINGWRNT